MDKGRAIGLLKQKSKEAVAIASLHYKNNEFLPWLRNIEDILELAFGVTSTEYRRIAKREETLNVKGTPEALQRAYRRLVHGIKLEVDSIIQKYEILGIDEKPLSKIESTGKVKLPIQLFDAMQFHPKVVEASRQLFQDGHYRDAIYRAFVALNNFVKEKSGLQPQELRGIKEHQIMAKVFDVNNPIIKLNELKTDTDISEQEGFKFLFMGATIGIRNPKAHENIIQDDPYKSLEYLGFASLLMKTIDFWEAGTT